MRPVVRVIKLCLQGQKKLDWYIKPDLLILIRGRGAGYRLVTSAYCVEDKIIENSLERFVKVIKKKSIDSNLT